MNLYICQIEEKFELLKAYASVNQSTHIEFILIQKPLGELDVVSCQIEANFYKELPQSLRLNEPECTSKLHPWNQFLERYSSINTSFCR